MILIFQYLFSSKCYDIDEYGVMFESPSREVLISATHSFDKSIYIIPSSTVEIRGGSYDNAPFYQYRDSLKNLKFNNCSKLQKLGSYCFAKLIISEIDMSSCIKLTELPICCLRECNSLTSIIFPPNLVTLAKGSLNNLNVIEKLEFPSSLTRIDGYENAYGRTVGNCPKLAHVSWGEHPSITSIGTHAFAIDSSLAYIYIPSTVTTISSAAFSLCPIAHIDIDDNNTKYATDGTSIYNKDYTNLIFCPPTKTGTYLINENVLYLNSNSLANTKFNEVILPIALKSIGNQCFIDSKITTITIPPNVTTLREGAFQGCAKLASIIFNTTTTELPKSLFNRCASLQRVIIPRTVHTVSESVFAGCVEMDYIYFPNTVKTIATGSFAGINGSVILDFEEGSNHRFENATLLSSDNKTVVAYIGNSTIQISITLSDNIEVIGMKAYKSYNLVSIDLGQNIRVIESEAFYGSNLISIHLPDSIEEIHASAFEACSSLSTVTFGQKLRLLKNRAFALSVIGNVILPNELKIIDSQTFFGCSKIGVVSLPSNLEQISSECFANSSLSSILIPSKTKTISQDAFAWSSLGTVTFAVVMNANATEISYLSFRNAHKLSSISFGLGTKVIGERAFEGCIELKTITLSDTIENISTRAFSGCTNLEEIKIGEGSTLSNIESLAFEKCPNFKIFDVSEKNPYFSSSKERDVLYDKEKTQIILYLVATNRTTFTIPSTVERIGFYSFQGAVNLERVEIVGDISYIGFAAFSGCSKLKYINIPMGMTTISSYAFFGCDSLSCDSFIFESNEQREALRSQIIAAGAPEVSLLHCPTGIFTAFFGPNSNSHILMSSILSSIFEDEEDK